MATSIKTKKLVYEATKVSVKQSDVVQTAALGAVTVESIHAARKKSGHGSITLKLPDGRLCDYSPAVINAIWQ
jgi:hypothetical protein